MSLPLSWIRFQVLRSTWTSNLQEVGVERVQQKSDCNHPTVSWAQGPFLRDVSHTWIAEDLKKKHLLTWGLRFFVLESIGNDRKLVGDRQLGDRTGDCVLSMSILQDEMWGVAMKKHYLLWWSSTQIFSTSARRFAVVLVSHSIIGVRKKVIRNRQTSTSMISFDTTRIWGIAGNNDIFFHRKALNFGPKLQKCFFKSRPPCTELHCRCQIATSGGGTLGYWQHSANST